VKSTMPPRSSATWICSCGKDWPCEHTQRDDTTFNFMGLPGEIRNKIYGHVLSPPINNQARTRSGAIILVDKGKSQCHDNVPRQPPHNILSVNRTIRTEARSLYFAMTDQFELGHVHKENVHKFQSWIRLLGDDISSSITQLTFTEALSMNSYCNGFISPHQPNTDRYIFKASFELTTFPPKVVVSTPRVTDVPNHSSSSDQFGPAPRWRPRNAFRVARMGLQNQIAGRIQGNFGCGHAGWYRCDDLLELLDAFVEAIERLFSQKAGWQQRCYWLRK
jgi:hypothetical protein